MQIAEVATLESKNLIEENNSYSLRYQFHLMTAICLHNCCYEAVEKKTRSERFLLGAKSIEFPGKENRHYNCRKIHFISSSRIEPQFLERDHIDNGFSRRFFVSEFSSRLLSPDFDNDSTIFIREIVLGTIQIDRRLSSLSLNLFLGH